MTFSRLVSSAPDRDPYEKEVLCGLVFSSSDPEDGQAIADLKNEQTTLAAELGGFYQFGTANYAPNILKANQYSTKAGLPPFADSEEDADEDGFSRETLGAELASWAQAGHGWYSTFRLWLWRFNRFYGQFNAPFLPNFYSLFGISYGVDLLIDLSIVLEAVFFAPLAPHEKNWSWLRIGATRLKNILLDDQRGFNILNNALWLTINVTVFFVSPQTAIILNMCGFGADTFVDMAKGFRELWRHGKLLWKAWRERKELEKTLKNTPEHDRTAEQKNELRKLQLIESSLKWKVAGLALKHGSQLIGTVLIFVGMALFWGFPPLAPASQIIMTVGAGLVSGASTLHLMKKIYLSAPGWYNMGKNIVTKGISLFSRYVLGRQPAPVVNKQPDAAVAVQEPLLGAAAEQKSALVSSSAPLAIPGRRESDPTLPLGSELKPKPLQAFSAPQPIPASSRGNNLAFKFGEAGLNPARQDQESSPKGKEKETHVEDYDPMLLLRHSANTASCPPADLPTHSKSFAVMSAERAKQKKQKKQEIVLVVTPSASPSACKEQINHTNLFKSRTQNQPVTCKVAYASSCPDTLPCYTPVQGK